MAESQFGMGNAYRGSSISSSETRSLVSTQSYSWKWCPRLCVFQGTATDPTNLPNASFVAFVALLFSLSTFQITPGRGRLPPTLSLVLLEISSVKGSFSSPLLPMALLGFLHIKCLAKTLM
ncbi:hypothetical protein EXN66_Car012548 [Channa argus]|uniref:Uncharacterized protein n=1 Tax=Channa argus TaxID=215402 RepID=A0A6G1Q342_CHAAH|nr:hypothetical protein EXN66_Car012548 [Channa argus]